MSGKAVTIDGRRFPSMRYAREHAKTILYASEPGTIITEPDASFVRALFFGHTGKADELSERSIVQFVRMKNIFGTISFYVQLDDRTQLDFSFWDAVKDMADRQNSI